MAGTGIAYPADAVTGSPQFTANQGRNAFAAAMAGATSGRPLGGLTGCRPGTPANTITATSTTWTMNPNGFAGYIDLETSATNSGYFFSFSGTITGAVTAAGGSPRTDIVWVKIDDSNTSDGSTGAPRVELDYSANTTTPPARAFVIAQINVPASGGGSPTVTWVAPSTVAAGGIQPVPTTVYPASPYLGQYVDDAALGLLRWNGTSWSPILSDAGSILLNYQAFSGNFLILDTAANGNNLFTATYPAYEVEVNLDTTSAATGISVLMRAASADYTTGNHTTRKIELNGATPGYANSTTDVKFIAGRANGTGGGASKFTIFAPQLPQYTKLNGQSHDAAISSMYWNHIPNTNVFTGMKVILDSTITGTGSVTVRGLRKI